MSEPFLGQIKIFAGNFAPRGWTLCDGQLLSIAQNSALFSLLGTTYGGDGRTTFGLPDLRGRAPVHAGSGPGLTPRLQGQKGGSESNTLNTAQLPAHNHAISATIKVSENDATTEEAAGNILSGATGSPIYGSQSTNEAMANTSVNLIIGNTGGNQSVNNMQPFLAMYYIIALLGIYPSRN